MNGEQRFWSMVNRSCVSVTYMEHMATPCWDWIAGQQGTGYGIFHIGEHGKQKILAHRYSYILANGNIPDGLEVDHLCRNRRCVNPQHLEAVTRKVNAQRGDLHQNNGNYLKTRCPQGHKYTPENTYIWHGMRHCRACNNAIPRKRVAKSGN